MSPHSPTSSQLWDLLEALAEDHLSRDDAARLEEIVLADAEARQLYFDYMALHGTLHWDAARSEDDTGEPVSTSGDLPESHRAGNANRDPETVETDRGSPINLPRPTAERGPKQTRFLLVTLSACLLLLLGVVLGWRWMRFPTTPGRPVARSEKGEERPETPQLVVDSGDQPAVARQPEPAEPMPPAIPRDHKSVGSTKAALPSVAHKPASPVAGEDPSRPNAGTTTTVRRVGSSTPVIVDFIDKQLAAGWQSAGVEPSAQATDAEWMRRLYLDLLGHIPPPKAVSRFLADDSADKRSRLVENLLDEPDYVRNWTTIWTNRLLGRSTSRDVNREALRRFLRRSFAENRPWDAIVADLISAEGTARENGAAGFLLAHLNNEAVPATAITARLFLGVQVHCTQCHNHPFNDWKQDQFWELNSFFQQTAQQSSKLIDRNVGGPIYYENRRGVIRAAFPEFNGQKIDPGANVDRREKLAALVTEGENPLMARALVNRMWAHFFGYGFTRPVDDMGPHNPPTHPELLDRLAREFVASGYDVKQLIRWICRSRAYHLSSRLADSNEIDRPEAGHQPLFSRVYLKPMTAEELYNSLLVATRAEQAGQTDWQAVAEKRQQWLQQFVTAHQTEENDETLSFNGTVPQALLMMNSELVRDALSTQSGSYFHEVALGPEGPMTKLRQLCLAALSREPRREEKQMLQKMLRQRLKSSASRRQAVVASLQDAFWAYLNSSEFILVH